MSPSSLCGVDSRVIPYQQEKQQQQTEERVLPRNYELIAEQLNNRRTIPMVVRRVSDTQTQTQTQTQTDTDRCV